jgi:hypothetical protein
MRSPRRAYNAAVAIETETLSLRGREGTDAFGPYLTLALEAGRPDAGSERWSLVGVDEVRLGRGADRRARRDRRVLSIELPDRALSAQHARLVRDREAWHLEDGGSKNGTFVGGARIDRRALDDRAVIDVGRVVLVFRAGAGSGDPGDARLAVDGDDLDTLDPVLAGAFALTVRIARSEVPISILGETGTGKELLARAIHVASARRGGLVAVNCAAIPANLVESELFGYRRGAFSGATDDRVGLIRASDGGTLFLDEIAELALAPQAALLRALQEREVVPLGTTAPIAVDLRVVSATCQDPAALVELGRFRRDLLARIAGHTIAIPPLRRRTEDLGLLAARLLARHGARGRTLDRDAARALFLHAWPLNVRELEHALAAALAITDGELELAHLPDSVRAPAPAPAAPPPSPETATLESLFREHAGNVSRVARALGTSRTQVRRLAERAGLDPDAFRRSR